MKYSEENPSRAQLNGYRPDDFPNLRRIGKSMGLDPHHLKLALDHAQNAIENYEIVCDLSPEEFELLKDLLRELSNG